MYVAVQSQPRTLGDWWNPFSADNAIAAAAYYYIHGKPMPPALPSANAPPAPSDPGTSLFIPDSSISDIWHNMWTGEITPAQRAVNTNACIASIQQMRQQAAAQGRPDPIPAGEENKCVTDQQALVKLIEADKTKSSSAWLIMLGVLGGIYFVTR